MIESPRTSEATRTAYIFFDLFNMELFDAAAFDKLAVSLSSGKVICLLKYIVLTEEGGDRMYVIPERVQHITFLNQLRMVGNNGSPCSAGEIIVIPKLGERSVTGYSQSLADANLLSVRASEAYKRDTLLRQLGEFFSIRDKSDNEISDF